MLMATRLFVARRLAGPRWPWQQPARLPATLFFVYRRSRASISPPRSTRRSRNKTHTLKHADSLRAGSARRYLPPECDCLPPPCVRACPGSLRSGRRTRRPIHCREHGRLGALRGWWLGSAAGRARRFAWHQQPKAATAEHGASRPLPRAGSASAGTVKGPARREGGRRASVERTVGQRRIVAAQV